jgi:hypothetical protein
VKEYGIKTFSWKTKFVLTHGCNQRKIKMTIEVNEQEMVSQFKYLGCRILNGDCRTNKKLNGCVKNNFCKSMRTQVKHDLCNTESKRSLK